MCVRNSNEEDEASGTEEKIGLEGVEESVRFVCREWRRWRLSDES